MRTDPMSQILELTNAKGVVSTGLLAIGKFSVRVEMHEGMKFNALTKGECSLIVGDGLPIELNEGDCFLITRGTPFTVSNDLGCPPTPAAAVFAEANGPYAVLDNGHSPTVRFIGGKMMASDNIDFLASALPTVVVLRRGMESAGRVTWLLEWLEAEISRDTPGSAAAAEQIMHMIFIEMIRLYTEPDEQRVGWLAALSDPRIARSIRAMHSDPGRRWRLDELAIECGLSRSQFAARFNKVVGIAPLEYLTKWRMILARNVLDKSSSTIAQVANTFGYGSEAAFGAAFKRVFGASPRRLVNQHKDS